MKQKIYAVLDALIPAALVATIAWTCLAAVDYFALSWAEHMVEGWGLLAPGWGAAHVRGLAMAGVLSVVPVVALIARAIYRSARASQAASG